MEEPEENRGSFQFGKFSFCEQQQKGEEPSHEDNADEANKSPVVHPGLSKTCHKAPQVIGKQSCENRHSWLLRGR